jgi:putative glycosyltransferase (TIGR04372 family)
MVMRFVEQQLSQIRAGGWPMLQAKIGTGIFFALLAPICLPLVLIIRLIKPLKIVRFTWLPSRLMGHAVIDLDAYLSQTALGLLPEKKILDLYYFESTQHSNRYWKKIVERNLPVARFFYYLHRFNALFPGWEPHYKKSYGELHASADPENLVGRVGPQITFTAQEEKTGMDFLQKMGMSKDAKFVCVQVRDDAHDAKLNPVGLPSGYNDFRNSDINDYVPAFEFLVEKGYWVIRMGKLTRNRLQTGNTRILDYSNSGERTEFLDIWLCFNCTFMITTGSGIDAVAAVGRKPLVFVNFLAYLDIAYMYRNSLVVFKHLYDAKSGRRLSLAEIVQRESETHYKSSDFYGSRGIAWQSNTSVEIKDAVEEMHDRLQNTWQESPQDLELQSAAGKFFASSTQYQSQYKDGFMPRFGTKFLRSL